MKYTQMTLDEMKAFLGPKFVVTVTTGYTKEFVFEYKLPLHPEVVVKVFTSIHQDTSAARKKGADAIRVCAVNTVRNIGWIKSVRVFRVEGWKHNLGRAIHKVIDVANGRFPNRPVVVPVLPEPVAPTEDLNIDEDTRLELLSLCNHYQR